MVTPWDFFAIQRKLQVIAAWKYTPVMWKSTQSFAVGCLNEKLSLGIRVQFEKREAFCGGCVP